MFGAQASTPAFGTSAFGTPSSTPAFGAPAFGTPSSTPAFGTWSSTPAFGTPSTPSFATGFGSSLFSTPFSSQTQQQQQQQQQTPLFQQPSTGLGFRTPFAATQATPFPNAQLTTQMAPVAPLPFSLADRDIQAIVDAYNEEPGNPKYAFKIMWAEAVAKLEGMESSERERLWPQLVQGFKDLSHRLKLQDEVIVSDTERLQMTQSNVKMLQRHFHAETLPWIERMRQKEQSLQRRLLRIMRIMEALEGKGYRMPLMKGEAELAEKLAAITRQLKGSGAELSRRVQNLLTVSRVQATAIGVGGSIYLPGSTKIHDHSIANMQEVLQQQTEAIARLGNVLKRDMRDMEIIMAEDTEMTQDTS
ncbi:nuclear pore complex protein NUP54 isoform X2 [Hevea brasiliensis]|uniref:nuclear pore complex protein NUP54 isoform X2 n=1 Tax=Hevea brasiliensis TaxID=3981 RepID=UPI0025D5F2CB|nr:nuclear pore complex protein NUP54 isoform X2 [Hevea brasiliensis]